MIGLNTFSEYFKGFTDCYIVIGGAACDDYFEREDYYQFTLKHCTIEGVLNRANELALICLKAKAFLDLSQRKEDGQRIDSNEIKKHRSDVFRLTATLTREDQIELPETIQKDMMTFVTLMEVNPPETKDFLKAMGITMVSTDQLIDQLKHSFKLD